MGQNGKEAIFLGIQRLVGNDDEKIGIGLLMVSV